MKPHTSYRTLELTIPSELLPYQRDETSFTMVILTDQSKRRVGRVLRRGKLE
jgi:hypothetical protein